MILSFTPNPALDQTYLAPGHQLDSSNRVALQHSQAGGKGVNVARVLHSQGFAVKALCPLGGSSGREFATELERSAIGAEAIPVAAPTRRSMAFHDPDEGITSVFNEVGTGYSAEEWERVEAAFERSLGIAHAAVICGSWPPDTPEETLRQLIGRATGRGVWTLVDTSGPALLLAAASGAVLKPNEHELREATGCASLEAGARQLLDLGAPEVYLSAGERGLYHFTRETPLAAHARLARQLHGNPTGAGDSAVAALASGQVQQLDREATLRKAVAWSASTVLMPTAGTLSPQHQALAGQVRYRVLPAGEQI